MSVHVHRWQYIVYSAVVDGLQCLIPGCLPDEDCVADCRVCSCMISTRLLISEYLLSASVTRASCCRFCLSSSIICLTTFIRSDSCLRLSSPRRLVRLATWTLRERTSSQHWALGGFGGASLFLGLWAHVSASRSIVTPSSIIPKLSFAMFSTKVLDSHNLSWSSSLSHSGSVLFPWWSPPLPQHLKYFPCGSSPFLPVRTTHRADPLKPSGWRTFSSPPHPPHPSLNPSGFPFIFHLIPQKYCPRLFGLFASFFPPLHEKLHLDLRKPFLRYCENQLLNTLTWQKVLKHV